MLCVEDWAEIRRLHRAEKMPVKVIARVVGADNLCHQAIFVDYATRAVVPPDPEMIQVGDAIWQGP